MSDQIKNVGGDRIAELATTLKQKRMNRRSVLATAGLAGAAAIGAGLLGGTTPAAEAATVSVYGPRGRRFFVTDADILNFALNLEYLEAEFYQRAAFGTGLSTTDNGGQSGNVTGGTRIPFTPGSVIEQYAMETAADELAHVRFLRANLGRAAVAEPVIDFTTAFTTAAVAAGVIAQGQTFDPFASEFGFLVGSYVFEDVGVTAYAGASTLIRNTAYLGAAARILAVEAYHAGSVRTQLFDTAAGIDAANKISVLRNTASAAADGVTPTDQGIAYAGPTANITPLDGNALVYVRSFPAVLNIVYLGGYDVPTQTGKGGFFPNGMNGRIK